MPVISVVLPFRDAERYLAGALDSVLSQGVTDFELLAVDDGSVDGSVAVVEAASRRDQRVRLLRTQGRGLPAALNTGIAAAKGRYVARMDGDDIALPRRFELQLAALEREPRLLVVGSAVDLIDDMGDVLETAWFPSGADSIRAVLEDGICCLCHPATMIRRDPLVAVGGYNTFVPLTEDFDLWLRLSRIGDLRNLDRTLLRYRLHSGSVAFRRTQEQLTSLVRSAVLHREGLDSAERARIETADLSALLARLRPGQDTAEALLDMGAWYVENAARIAAPRVVRQLAAQLASFAPDHRRRWLERRLRQAAALVTQSMGHRFRACSYLLGRGRDAAEDGVLWRAILRPPTVAVVRDPPGPSNPPGGYLDRLNFYEDGLRILVFGWLPFVASAPPRDIALVLPCAATITGFRFMRRVDVANEVGLDHLYAGFRIVVALVRPLEHDKERLRLWSRSSTGQWQPLHDDATIVDVPAE